MEVLTQGSFDTFLSHAHTDAETVDILGQQLEDGSRLRIWLDKWILVPGEQWQQHMARGLDDAKSCAVCIGQTTPRGWFRQEIERALNRQARESTFRVIPVLLPNGDPSLIDAFLELRTWVVFRNGIHDHLALHTLACGIRGVAPGRPPNPPCDTSSKLDGVREKLRTIQILRLDKLIDNRVALEYQRRLLDRLIEE